MSREIYQINSKDTKYALYYCRAGKVSKNAGYSKAGRSWHLVFAKGPDPWLNCRQVQARWVSSEKSGLVSWCLHLLPDGEALTKPFSWGDENFR